MSNIASPAEIIFEKRARSKVIERLRGSPRADVRDLARLIEALPAQPRRPSKSQTSWQSKYKAVSANGGSGTVC